MNLCTRRRSVNLILGIVPFMALLSSSCSTHSSDVPEQNAYVALNDPIQEQEKPEQGRPEHGKPNSDSPSRTGAEEPRDVKETDNEPVIDEMRAAISQGPITRDLEDQINLLLQDDACLAKYGWPKWRHEVMKLLLAVKTTGAAEYVLTQMLDNSTDLVEANKEALDSFLLDIYVLKGCEYRLEKLIPVYADKEEMFAKVIHVLASLHTKTAKRVLLRWEGTFVDEHCNQIVANAIRKISEI